MKRAKQIVTFLKENHDTDITLKGGARVVSHTTLLASASEPLAAMLQSPLTERVDGRPQLTFPTMTVGAWGLFERWMTEDAVWAERG